MTALPGWDSTPTDTASTVTPSSAIGSAARARMPVVVSPTWMPLTVVPACRSIPVRPPRMVPPVICMPELRLRSALSTPSVVRFLTTTPVVPPEVTRPSSPPIRVRLLALTSPAPRSTRTPVRLFLTVRPSIWVPLPPIAMPATRALSIVEPVTCRFLVVFSATMPVRPPVIVIASNSTFTELTCRNTPFGSSVVVTLCTLLSVVRLSSSPPAWSPTRSGRWISTFFWPEIDTP